MGNTNPNEFFEFDHWKAPLRVKLDSNLGALPLSYVHVKKLDFQFCLYFFVLEPFLILVAFFFSNFETSKNNLISGKCFNLGQCNRMYFLSFLDLNLIFGSFLHRKSGLWIEN